MSLVMARITTVHDKGFAFAETAEGDSIYIAPNVREALKISRRGQRVQLKVKQGKKGLAALMPPSTSRVSWKDWQLGENQVKIPDTQPGSLHTISFACWRCGLTLAEAAEIFKFKEGASWTQSELAHVLKRGNSFENKWKLAAGVPVRGFTALCRKCGHNVGSIYPERYDDADPELSFPCVKLYHVRERDANDAIINSTVVVGDTRESAEYEISRLVSLHNPVGGAASGPARVQVRTTARTHELIQRAKAAEEQRDVAEEQRNVAEEQRRLEEQQRAAAQRAAQAAAQATAQQRAAAQAAESAALAEAQRREKAEAEKAKEAAARARAEADARNAEAHAREVEEAAARAKADAEARLAELSLHAEGKPVFECEAARGDFRPYPAEIQEKLLRASSARDPCVWQQSGHSYTILWGDDDNSHNQVNLRTLKQRCIRVIRRAGNVDALTTPPQHWACDWGAVDDDAPAALALHKLEDRETLVALQACITPARPDWLNHGPDVAEVSPPYSSLNLVGAWRVEHRHLWASYCCAQRKISDQIQTLKKTCGIDVHELRTSLDEASQRLPNATELQDGGNEMYLMHGTKPNVLLQALQGGLNERFSKGLFGQGTYFAEDAGKCDQYVTSDQGDERSPSELHARLYGADGHPGGRIFYLFVCRVMMGAYQTTHDSCCGKNGKPLRRECDQIEGAPQGMLYNALVALAARDLKKDPLRYREFIVYHGDQIYPEYLVAFRRGLAPVGLS